VRSVGPSAPVDFVPDAAHYDLTVGRVDDLEIDQGSDGVGASCLWTTVIVQANSTKESARTATGRLGATHPLVTASVRATVGELPDWQPQACLDGTYAGHE
jgi:hypothetical protein